MEQIITWLQVNWLELFGTVAALAYLYFSIKQKIWLWPLGILTSLVYVFIFFNAKFYADAGLNFYYVIISIYGWYFWMNRKSNSKSESIPIKQTDKRLALQLTAASIVVFILIAFILKNYTDSTVPYGDAFTTSLSIIATWMLAKKILEQWLVWIVVDAVSMLLYIYKDLQITAVLFLVYTALAVYGYFEWKKSLAQTKPAYDN